MASEVHSINEINQPSQGDGSSKEKNDVSTTTRLDDIEADASCEGDADINEREKLVQQVDKKELTPVEAFKWNVEGDQSPCKHYDVQIWP